MGEATVKRWRARVRPCSSTVIDKLPRFTRADLTLTGFGRINRATVAIMITTTTAATDHFFTLLLIFIPGLFTSFQNFNEIESIDPVTYERTTDQCCDDSCQRRPQVGGGLDHER